MPSRMLLLLSFAAATAPATAFAQGTGTAAAPGQAQADSVVRELVGRLDLERYKATVKGLTQFGDRRQGTDRNRAAVDWIEAQLKSYGCTNTARIHYEFNGRQIRPADSARISREAGLPMPYAAGSRDRAGNVLKGNRTTTGVNLKAELQPDTALRRINAQPDTPGPREEVYCTKVGTTHPDEMYIVGGHMDGHGFGAAANDDGSGTAVVM